MLHPVASLPALPRAVPHPRVFRWNRSCMLHIAFVPRSADRIAAAYLSSNPRHGSSLLDRTLRPFSNRPSRVGTCQTEFSQLSTESEPGPAAQDAPLNHPNKDSLRSSESFQSAFKMPSIPCLKPATFLFAPYSFSLFLELSSSHPPKRDLNPTQPIPIYGRVVRTVFLLGGLKKAKESGIFDDDLLKGTSFKREGGKKAAKPWTIRSSFLTWDKL